MTKPITKNQRGFTIIELLIATVIFSLMLLIATASIMYITRSYVKGEVGIQTADVARSIITSLSQDIEFNSYNIISNQVSSLSIAPYTNTNDNYALCVGSHVYFYTLDEELDSTKPANIGETSQFSPHALFVGSYSGSCPATSVSQMNDAPTGFYSNSYQELLNQHMRLGQLSVTQLKDSSGNLRNAFQISVTVAYGDDDLLTDKAPASYGSNRKAPTGFAWSPPPGPSFTYSCLSNNFGGQFCSVATLTAVASSRIN